MRATILAAAGAAFAAAAPAQFTILMTAGTSDEHTLATDPFEVDLIRSDEIYEVRPQAGPAYSARPFLPTALQWYYVGDQDADGLYVDAATAGPGGDIDAIFVKAGTTGPVSPRDVFFSIAATSTNLPGVATSDVVRFSGQGTREVFLTEVLLATATGGTSLNLDALAQSAAGDLFFSFSLTETLTLGSVDDGDVLMIPASAITYDVNGNVSAITADSTVRVLTEADLIAMVNNSGFRTSVGGQVTTSFELSGLEIDPNGGTFTSTSTPAMTLPNLLFVWNDFSNDGAIVSTANNGTIATINGVPMGSTVATQGDQLGWLPDSTGTNGPGGLALVANQPVAYTLQSYPRNLHTSGSGQTLLRFELAGGTPNGASAVAWSVESAVAGGTFPSVPSPFGELALSAPVVVDLVFHDALGNAVSQWFVLPTTGLSGINVAAQALDLSTFELSTPAAFSFL